MLCYYHVKISSTSNQSFELIEYWYCSISLQNLSIQLEVYFKWNPAHNTCSSIQIYNL